MTSRRRPGASRNGSGDRTLSKNARSQQLRSCSFFSLPKNCNFSIFWGPKGARLKVLVPPHFGVVCCLFSDTSPEGSRDPFWSHFGRFWSDFGMDLGSNFVSGERGISRENLAKTLHKILQTAWATPPACTNSEGAAVSR